MGSSSSSTASLPCMGADANTLTVSGHSAGCYMSERMLLIHSDIIRGAGLFQCWPYGTDYFTEVTSDSATASSLSTISIAAIDAAESAGEIAATSNLANNSVYIYSGSEDDITPPVG